MLEDDSANPADVLAEEGVISLLSGHQLPTPDEAFRHPDPAKAARFGRWPSGLGPGILFPIADPYGRVTFHFRPDRPRLRDGKSVRYEACAGARLVIHVPRRVRRLLRDRTVELWITEGAKKVYAGVGAGLCIVGLMGVDGFVSRTEDGHSEPLPDWDAFDLHGRIVLVAFDSDVMTKPEVQGARDRLTRFLRGRGAIVVPVSIPHGADGQKVGLDDFIAAGGSAAELRADALASALSGGPSAPDDSETCSCTSCPSRARVTFLERRLLDRSDELDALQVANATLSVKLTRQEEEGRVERRVTLAEQRLGRVTTLSPAHRAELRALAQIATATALSQGITDPIVTADAVATVAPGSTGTVGRHLSLLGGLPGFPIKRDTRWYGAESRTHYILPTTDRAELLDLLATWAEGLESKPRPPKRATCEKCPAGTSTTTATVCDGCGSVLKRRRDAGKTAKNAVLGDDSRGAVPHTLTSSFR